MRVVSDSSPLIASAKGDGCELLFRLFPGIIVPEAVHRECVLLAPMAAGAAAIRNAVESGALEIRTIAGHPMLPALRLRLGDGEAEAIALAASLPGSLLLIEDADGRAAAEAAGLRCMGNLGIISLAKKTGLIPAVRPHVALLRANGIFYSEALIRRFLAEHGE